ncbi:MAG: transcriptional repressor [Patescibacteria group bacterium]
MTHPALTHLKAGGHRLTPSRQGIIELLSTAKQPLTPAETLESLAKKGIAADKVTVYREIAFLQGQGILVPIQLNDRSKRYELAELEHHHHLVCLNCDKVEDVDVADDFGAAEKAIKKQTGFSVQRHSLEFFGTCANCT